MCMSNHAIIIGLTNDYINDDAIHCLVRRAAVLPIVLINAVEDVRFSEVGVIASLEIQANIETFRNKITEYQVEGSLNCLNHFNSK